MAGTALQFTLRKMQALLRQPTTYAVLAAVIVALGVSGPFGTYAEFTIGPRFTYWAIIVVSTFAAGYFCGTFLTRLIAAERGYFVAVPVAGIASGVPVTLVVLVINSLAYPSYGFDSVEIGGLFLSCIAVSVSIVAVFAAFNRTPDAAPAPDAAVPAIQAPRLIERLPHALRGDLVSLSVSDHYVDVVTIKGRHMLLMRLGDAIAETDGVDGIQIHRSHWVARKHVAEVRRASGKATVRTSAGDLLPVSRTFLPAVREAGLIP